MGDALLRLLNGFLREGGAGGAIRRKRDFDGALKLLKEAVKKNSDLAASLGAAAHLIHGSSEGRFSITYCPGHLTRQEIEGAGFRYARLEEMVDRYQPSSLTDGFNTVNGEEVFYISNPALGLWAHRSRFDSA